MKIGVVLQELPVSPGHNTTAANISHPDGNHDIYAYYILHLTLKQREGNVPEHNIELTCTLENLPQKRSFKML